MNVRKSDNFFGIMESIILESGKIVKRMELEYGNPKMEIFIWDSGPKEKLKDMVFI